MFRRAKEHVSRLDHYRSVWTPFSAVQVANPSGHIRWRLIFVWAHRKFLSFSRRNSGISHWFGTRPIGTDAVLDRIEKRSITECGPLPALAKPRCEAQTGKSEGLFSPAYRVGPDAFGVSLSDLGLSALWHGFLRCWHAWLPGGKSSVTRLCTLARGLVH